MKSKTQTAAALEIEITELEKNNNEIAELGKEMATILRDQCVRLGLRLVRGSYRDRSCMLHAAADLQDILKSTTRNDLRAVLLSQARVGIKMARANNEPVNWSRN
jgi:RNA:NAD 2'-phosphotransferase (TPT1/KptA family)